MNGCSGVTTRSAKYINSFSTNNCSISFDPSNKHLSQIEEWKKKSHYFTNCAQKEICDPFGIFDANEDNICFNCLETRDSLREKVNFLLK